MWTTVQSCVQTTVAAEDNSPAPSFSGRRHAVPSSYSVPHHRGGCRVLRTHYGASIYRHPCFLCDLLSRSFLLDSRRDLCPRGPAGILHWGDCWRSGALPGPGLVHPGSQLRPMEVLRLSQLWPRWVWRRPVAQPVCIVHYFCPQFAGTFWGMGGDGCLPVLPAAQSPASHFPFS